mmetsp:Transcript_21563/g.50747  ORF Transcript_21563/g.50747 Transcript_21563/m.50747 type:complete len:204 (+) Transcript_21563:1131-1742(+)
MAVCPPDPVSSTSTIPSRTDSTDTHSGATCSTTARCLLISGGERIALRYRRTFTVGPLRLRGGVSVSTRSQSTPIRVRRPLRSSIALRVLISSASSMTANTCCWAAASLPMPSFLQKNPMVVAFNKRVRAAIPAVKKRTRSPTSGRMASSSLTTSAMARPTAPRRPPYDTTAHSRQENPYRHTLDRAGFRRATVNPRIRCRAR